MRIKMISGCKVAANEFGSATVFWPKGSKHEAVADWEKALFHDLVASRLAAEIMATETKSAGPAPENKAVGAAPENKGEWTAEHKGAGKYIVLNPEGQQVGGLYAKDEAAALADQYNAAA